MISGPADPTFAARQGLARPLFRRRYPTLPGLTGLGNAPLFWNFLGPLLGILISWIFFWILLPGILGSVAETRESNLIPPSSPAGGWGYPRTPF